MKTQPLCRIYLHPTAATPATVTSIQSRTGLTAVAGTNPNAATLIRLPIPAAVRHDDYEGFEPFGGGAA